MKTVVTFGTFDGFHDGHKAMIREARALGDYLIVVVSQDHLVRALKGRNPRMKLQERLEQLRTLEWVDEVIASDPELGTWKIVKERRPDIVAIGYDQDALGEDLEKHLPDMGYAPEIRVLTHHMRNR